MKKGLKTIWHNFIQKREKVKQYRALYEKQIKQYQQKVAKLDPTTKAEEIANLQSEIDVLQRLIKIKNTKDDVVKQDFDKKNVFEIENLNFWYNKDKQVLFDINLKIKRNKITALIGKSGCGKSTFIRCLNKLNDLNENVRWNGKIFFLGKNINSGIINDLTLRTRVGMVFQQLTPFNFSIFENIAYGLRAHGIHNKQAIHEIVEQALKSTALWDEVKDNLHRNANTLSGGQQQRLCIARAIALQPDVLLMDEPTSALDSIATNSIELLIQQLKEKYTIIIVTHSMAQTIRITDETIFFANGRVVEQGTTKQIFTRPKQKETNRYISGRN
ncbi:phosphate ABC transporter ATP-binding protein PstB [Mycoplasmoides pneumoniae]|uniref:Phosphate import ATP-binding protein PstB n=4 Tax=Mycoplasmoides pneumoniae TaxID=2104 RepID=PSTB_MYCPN|nr:phosphate ABC transporter ATP-binding protein PstB [Mycoplasmoides pneumoniae]P75186.1 RecName: Full=Phosphate import ATP-binding protein PstB; AltName: Full=ABC phosphate transporter; AltName: Full=Phosphate-transporting ATPase [Mycoplasmoides pneumoniae M129]AAB95881.1 phosphate specific [Mycoplasmoides pneumoniae M129]ADK86847.1 phosphate ABC transporter, ATP-binding protein [Mycoplasmoides pneumoniae FH]AGC04483.1 phosphate ABC transporter ATP-binding protein [Mycoplasmoides pneumoniae M